MSAEHEKEPPPAAAAAAALKRPRGGDGGLDGAGGPGVQLGSPEKKKRKAAAAAAAQGSCFPPPSEYAPPPNPSADHLVAANPFDDNYNTVCYKPLPAGNPYFAGPNYPGFGGYNAFRMPPHLLPRMASQYGASFPLRSQPHAFSPNAVGLVFSRPQAMSFGPPENVAFANQPSYHANVSQNLALPGQHFRSNPGENFGHMPSQNTPQVAHHELPLPFGPGNQPHFNSAQVEPSPPYGPLPNSYGQNKPVQKPGSNRHGPPPTPHHQHSAEEAGNADLKPAPQHVPAGPESHPPKPAEALNSGHANGTQNKPPLPRGPEKGGHCTPLHPSQHGRPPSEPVYPCGICTHEVNDDQDAILCEASCQKWFHRICTGMTESAYGLLTAEASAVWGCDTCMADKDVQLMRTREAAGPPVSSAEA